MKLSIMKLSIHNVFFPKMFSQFDKPLHFQEISHTGEHIILPREVLVIDPGGRRSSLMACLLVGRPGGAAAPAPVQLELVWLEPAILEDAHLLVCRCRLPANVTSSHWSLRLAGTVKSNIGGKTTPTPS
jgi:hypothetical protein